MVDFFKDMVSRNFIPKLNNINQLNVVVEDGCEIAVNIQSNSLGPDVIKQTINPEKAKGGNL